MVDLGGVIADLLFKWNLDTYILLRIRVVMGFLLIPYYVLLLALLMVAKPPGMTVLDTLCDTLMVYIMGAMQAAPFKNHMFPLWALFLVSFRSGVNFMSKYDILFELTNMLKLWATVLLNVKHGSKSWRTQFWLFWGVMFLNSLYRIGARRVASKSLWHGRSSEFIHEYMGATADHDRSSFNPETMEGCKFLVSGKSKPQKSTRAGHIPSIDGALRSVITLDKIWGHNGSPLLRPISKEKANMKDLSLALALSRLLRCRVEGGRLHADTVSMTRKLICSRIRADDKVVAAGVLGLDLMFLTQQLHTGYPMVFCQGLRSLYFPFLVFLVKCISLFWLRQDINRLSPGDDTDQIITAATTGLVLVIEFMAVVRYLTSYWTISLLVCNYVDCSNRCIRYVLGRMISCVPVFLTEELFITCSSRYDFLQSSKYREGKLKMVPINWKSSAKVFFLSSAKVFSRKNTFANESLMAAVIQALARYMDTSDCSECLPSPRSRASDTAKRYWSALLGVEHDQDRPARCSHVILVCHIATSLCQMKLDRDRGMTNRGNSSRPHPADTKLHKANKLVANCLSSYCLYLLISKSNLLPGDIFVSKKVLQDTVQHAHDMLESCDSLQSRYDKLITAVSQEAAGSQLQLTGNILQQGAIMGKHLIDNIEEEDARWEILAEIWADMLVQIAPSSKAQEHGKDLNSGDAELITLAWALLCHCGIEKSELWPEEH